METFRVTTPDGLSIAAVSAGASAGPEILFIHGFSQCHLTWTRQLGDAGLGSRFRMAAYDLRGHGASDKPEDGAFYRDDARWADEVKAVIAAAGFTRPVLVAWSYAGRVVTDYVRVHGQDGIAGIVFVSAVTRSKGSFWGPSMKLTGPMTSDDIAVNVAASRAFVRACFEKPPSPEEFETTLAFNMLIPARVRALVLDRTRNEGDMLPRITVPTLVVHGDRDSIVLVESGRDAASAVPGAKLSVYEGIGHAPFIEDTPRFNRELAAFVGGARAAR